MSINKLSKKDELFLGAILDHIASKYSPEDAENINLYEELKIANEELTGRMMQFSENKECMELLSNKIYVEVIK